MAGVDPVPGSVTTFGASRSTSLDSTIMLRVEVTNGSARSFSSASSSPAMSTARRWTSASASPEIVYAPTTAGCRFAAARSCCGDVRPGR